MMFTNLIIKKQDLVAWSDVINMINIVSSSSMLRITTIRLVHKSEKSQASEVDIAEMSGIAPKNAFEFMARQDGGCEHLGFSRVDINNYLRTKRNSTIKSGETGGVLEYMQRIKEEDPSSFYVKA
ncbi:hypothetical protein V2J09_004575 [Rumex salicifolius]